MEQPHFNPSLKPSDFSKSNLLEARRQFHESLGKYLLISYIDSRRAGLDDEITNPVDVHEQQRNIGRRAELKHLVQNFSHYLDNLINDSKDE